MKSNFFWNGAVKSGRRVPTFRRNDLPHLEGVKSKPIKQVALLARRANSQNSTLQKHTQLYDNGKAISVRGREGSHIL
jgi:hypothetical protein